MQTQQILSASILDILFDGRNKSYGAYDLRKNYNKRVIYALSGTFIICLSFTMASFFLNTNQASFVPIFVTDIELKSVKEKSLPEPKLPKAIVQPKPQSPIAQFAVNIPIITPDKLVASNEVVKSID